MQGENYRDAWTIAKARHGDIVTFPKYKTRIDYIWVSQHFPFEILTSSHIESGASDHKPEVLEIDISSAVKNNL